MVSPERLIDLFDRLVAEVVDRLDGLDDWGPSGLRQGQYRHDIVADEVLVPGLLAEGLAVLSEESGLVGSGPITVVVDPVDGSTNGSRRLPWYASSLCAVDEDGPLAAVVVNLASGERYRATRGGGAESVGGPPIGPSGCTALGDAIIGFSGLPPGHGGWRQFRALGAAALDMCAVATGRLDGYVDVDGAHGPWDYLGAWLVCREAGVALGDSRGADLVVVDPDARRGPVAAATDELLGQLLAMTDRWARA